MPPVDESAPARLPEPGWYADPARRWRLRWWDGAGWTSRVSNGTRVADEPLPGSAPDGRARLPLRALWWALGGIVAGEVIGGLFDLVAYVASNNRYVVELIAGQFGLWLGFAGAVVVVSRRYGSGHPFQDFAVRALRSDVGRGIGWAIAMRVAAVVVVLPLVLGFRRYFEHVPASSPLEGHRGDLGAEVTISVIAALGAPFIEELLFRGVILGSLQSLGRTPAIVVQGLLFGAVHTSPDAGRANALTFLGIGVGGVILGWLATHYRRLGPGMWTHFFFNLEAVALLPFS